MFIDARGSAAAWQRLLDPKHRKSDPDLRARAPRGDKIVQLRIGHGKQDSCRVFEVPFVALVYVALIAISKPMDEKRSVATAENDNRSKSIGLAFTRAGYPLFDNRVTVIGIDFTLRRNEWGIGL